MFSNTIQKYQFSGAHAMTNLDSILKSRDITLPTKVRPVKAMLFPAVICRRLRLVLCYGLPWKKAEIILSLLRLHPSTAFQTLLLTMRATPFLLRDSCPQ